MENIKAQAQAETASRGNILVADDDEPFRRSVGKSLVKAGFHCDFAASAAEAIELLRTKEYDALLSDINMPGNCGLEFIENLPTIAAGLPVILLTGDPSMATATRSVRLRVTAYLTKPLDMTELCALLAPAVAESRSLRVLKDKRQQLQAWDREIARIQRLLEQNPASERQTAMQSYLRLTLRQLVVSLIELEHLLIHDGERLGTDRAFEHQDLFRALRKTVGVLQKTKDHFRSKELGELRKELETLLAKPDKLGPELRGPG